MNSSKVFNDVVHYLERISLDGSDIDYSEISKIAISPAALFQRIFVFVSGVSIADYVRKRRLTLAGQDLNGKHVSVLDVTVKYGFGSHSAFSRAFKEHHGITPSEAKLDTVKLNEYLPINFLDMRFIGGKRIMAEMKKIVYKETPERLMVGHHYEASFYTVGDVWQNERNSPVHEKLRTLPESCFCCDDIDPCDGIGLSYNFRGEDKDHFDYIVGDFVKPGTDLPEGLTAKHITGGTTAHIQIEGNNMADISYSAYLLITEAIEKTNMAIDYDNFYWCDVYTIERFAEPMKRGEKIVVDYILPVKKVAS